MATWLPLTLLAIPNHPYLYLGVGRSASSAKPGKQLGAMMNPLTVVLGQKRKENNDSDTMRVLQLRQIGRTAREQFQFHFT